MEDISFGNSGSEESVKMTALSDWEISKRNGKSDERVARLLDLFKENGSSMDLNWSLFRAASENYKFDSLLRPFPKMFLDQHEEKMINDLRQVAATAKSIKDIIDMLQDGSIDERLLDLLLWVSNPSYKLRQVKQSEYQNILRKVFEPCASTAYPHYIFEVDHSLKASTAKFLSLAKQYGVRYGFHGSRLENFYSILNHGLQVSMNKVAAFGPGVYIASDLSISLLYSPAGLSWGGSNFGGSLSVVAVCEIIDHPHVKCQDDKLSLRKYADGVGNSQVPNKYLIVQNSDLVRVTHLLVYTTPKSKLMPKTRLGMPTMMLLYVILLLIIACYNSPYMIKKLFRN